VLLRCSAGRQVPRPAPRHTTCSSTDCWHSRCCRGASRLWMIAATDPRICAAHCWQPAHPVKALTNRADRAELSTTAHHPQTH
jgi:hypothetical protein